MNGTTRIQSNVALNTKSGCNPINPGTESVQININVQAKGNLIKITTIDRACGEAFSRTYDVRAQDDETFDLPDDLHITTLEMLDGIARRFMRFARHGFDREP